MTPIRPLTRCRVPGHGTRCELGQERRHDRYPRTTERRMALGWEWRAEQGDGNQRRVTYRS